MANKDIQDGVYVARNKPKELPKLYEEELSPLDLKWNGKGWSSDATSVKTPKKDSIPEIYPTQDGTSQRLSIDRGKQGIPEKMADVNLMEADGGSPMDYMDAPASGVAKAFSFAMLPKNEARAVQYAMMKDLKGRPTAEAVMRGNDKFRDEFTTASKRIQDSNIPIKHSAGDGGYIENGITWNDDLKAYEYKPREMDVGTDNPNTDIHETLHYYHGEASKANPNVQTRVDKNGNIQRYNLSDMQDETADKLDNIYLNSKVGDVYKKYGDVKKKDLKLYNLRNDLKNQGIPTEGRLAIDLADYGGMILPEKGGIFLTPSYVKNGYTPHAGFESKNYVKEFDELGQSRIGTEEGSNNIIAESLTSRVNDNYLRKMGINPDEVSDIALTNHLPYDEAEELELIKKYKDTPDYNEYMARTPAKIRPTGSHANKFFDKEAKYMEANGGDHSPDWFEAVHDKWFGDKYGRLDEDEMEALFRDWKNNNGMQLNPQEVLRGNVAKYNFNDRTANKYMSLNDEQRAVIDSKLKDGAKITFDGKYWLEELPSLDRGLGNYRVIDINQKQGNSIIESMIDDEKKWRDEYTKDAEIFTDEP